MRIGQMRENALHLMLFAGLVIGGCASTPDKSTPAAFVKGLLSTGESVLGQRITYPDNSPAHVTAVIVTLPVNGETGWHHHDVPLFGYVLEGELTVDYEGTGERVYRRGEALMEAIVTRHNGRNSGTERARILAVYIGAEGIPNSVSVKKK